MIFHCLFEQSGTFKNEFKKLGYIARDYDILDEFDETDFIVDLFKEIHCCYKRERETIFDNISKEDVILAFFPCVRFEAQVILCMTGKASQCKNWSDEKKLEWSIELNDSLNEMYKLISELVIICIRKGLKLIIENPYNPQHYLTRYWCIEPAIIDLNRRNRGDYFEKPTQYWFINCEPKHNLIFEPITVHPKKKITETHDKVERSLISPEYANRFIREFIIDNE